MAFNFNNVVFNELIATNTSNYREPTELEMTNGIVPNTQLNSELVNSFLYKCSAGIKQIQENGAISYMPGKVYNKGNVISCNVLINNVISVYLFECNKDNVTTAPLQGIENNSDSGYIYFTSNELLDDSWNRIFVKNYAEVDLSIPEFSKSGSEARDTDFRYVSLYTLDNKQINFNLNTVFRIIIKRGGSVLSASIGITYDEATDKCVANVNEVYCNNYSMDSITSIWNEDSKFKDFALLGCFLYLNPTTNKIDLCICPRKDIGTTQTINISIKEIKGDIKVELKDNGDTGTILDQNIKKIPFIEGASTEYKKAFQIYETFDKLNYEDMFKRGIVICDDTVNNDLVVYSCLGTSKSGRYGANFFDLRDKYLSTVKGQDNKLSNTVLQHSLDSLVNIEPQFTGVMILVCPANVVVNEQNFNIPDGIWGYGIAELYDIANFAPNANYTSIPSWLVSYAGPNSYLVGFDASRCSSIYSDSIINNFYLDSINVYRYVYFI